LLNSVDDLMRPNVPRRRHERRSRPVAGRKARADILEGWTLLLDDRFGVLDICEQPIVFRRRQVQLGQQLLNLSIDLIGNCRTDLAVELR